MPTLTVTAKGQVTLKKEVLKHLGVKPGDRIDVDLSTSGKAMLRARKGKGDIRDFFGCLESKIDRVLTIEEITKATQEAWAGKR